MIEARNWSTMTEELSPDKVGSIARELLRYLVCHPDAKDTLDGIVQWWLRQQGRAHWPCCAPTAFSSKPADQGCHPITSSTRSNARPSPRSSTVHKVYGPFWHPGSPYLPINWLRVLRSAEASRFGHDGSQKRHRGAVRPEKCVALCGGCETGMYVIAAFFAHVLRGYTRRACIGFLLILQEVRRVCKTRNQFIPIRGEGCA